MTTPLASNRGPVKVYGNVVSPYARKVYWALEWKGIPFEAIDVLPHAESLPFREISWLGKIPAFEDESVRLCDSSVICDYLEHRHPEPTLYPKDPADRARALWLEEYADTHLQDILLRGLVVEFLVKPHVRGEPTNEARVADILANRLPRELGYLESLLEAIPETGATTYLVGGDLSIADLAVSTGFLNARDAGFEVDASTHPRLAGYLEGLARLPLYEKRAAVEARYMASIAPPV